MMTGIDWEKIENGLLAFMYKEFIQDKRRRFTARNLKEEAARNLPFNFVLEALDSLSNDGLTKKENVESKSNFVPVPISLLGHSSVTTYLITKEGVDSFAGKPATETDFAIKELASLTYAISHFDPDQYDPFAKLHEHGETSSLTPDDIPASNRTVTVDHNRPEYKEGVENLEQATEAFANDESLSNELGPEKSGLVQILKGARDLLDNHKIGLKLYMGAIISPLERLKEIASEHPGATWGAFVSTALNALLRLIERL